MSKYDWITENDDGSVTGRTPGCGCCSDYEENVSLADVEEYIDSLKEDLKIAEEIREHLKNRG